MRRLLTAARSSSMSGAPCSACWKGFNVALFTEALANTLPKKLVAVISTAEPVIAAVALSAARHASTAVVLLSTQVTSTCPPPVRGRSRKSSAVQQAQASFVSYGCRLDTAKYRVWCSCGISHPMAQYWYRLHIPDLCTQQLLPFCRAEDLNNRIPARLSC